jgi:hypothetical protein
MRFLITLLALITGFSAADAARPQSAETRASVALTTEAAVASFENIVSSELIAHHSAPHSVQFSPVIYTVALPVALSPVTRADLLRE